MEAEIYSLAGEVVGQMELSEKVFGVPMNEGVVHQAVVRQMANARRGTADTKTRAEVSGGGRKMRPQKHTGHSRQGSRRAPHWKGGGVAFGPHPRSYAQRMPKKMRRLALRCLLSQKARERQLVVVKDFALPAPKTKEMVQALTALGLDGGSALLATRGVDPALVRTARNIPRVKTTPASLLNVYDLLRYARLIISVDGVKEIEDLWGRE